jgi:hypothetical protein
MNCPQDVAAYAHYICEACVVRSTLERELTSRCADTVLLMLERARFVDLTNHWARGTLKTYQSKYTVIQEFSTDLAVPMLQPTVLARPPHGEAIKLMWAQERYSLFPSEWRRRDSLLAESIKFGSIRGVRSAASHFWLWDLLLTHPEKLTLGFKDRPTIVEGCSPTDEISYTYFTDGMRRRLGDNPKPSAVLLLDHILWINRYYTRLYAAAPKDDIRIELCRAAITHATSYLGWLRACETFGLCWKDVTRIEPPDGPSVGLPCGIGVILAKLLAQTKSNQVATADVVMAFMSASGISLGQWLNRLEALLPDCEYRPDAFIMAHRDGRPWTSHYYRYTHFYPVLSLMRSLGDVYLQKYDETKGRELIKAFHSFGTMRRSARSIASKKRPQTIRAGNSAEVIEHGRWRINRSSLDMPTAYLEWPIADRLCITQFSQ